MRELKTIARESIPLCLDRADRYRLLNDPIQAESICQDVLHIDPDNQRALVMLLLSLSDQFDEGSHLFPEAEAVLPRLQGAYERAYYAGILWERRAVARLRQGGLGSEAVALPWIETALGYFEQAEAVRPENCDEARLRWNSCLRLCQRYQLQPESGPTVPAPVGED